MIPPYSKDTRVIVLTVGLPASGKSTWARELVASEPLRWKRINRDDIRFMLHGSCHSYTDGKHEQSVTDVCEAALFSMLSSGYDVVLDNTHLKEADRKTIHQIAEELGDTIVVEKVFEVPLEECLKRNALRTGVACVPDEVIFKMASKADVDPVTGKFKLLKDKMTEYRTF